MNPSSSHITSSIDTSPSTSLPSLIHVPDGVCMALVEDIVNGHVWDPSKRPRKNPPRPMNKFILYRSYFIKDKYGRLEGNGQRKASAEAGRVWKNMSMKDQGFWATLANDIDARHKSRFPQYKFNPRDAKDIKRRGHKAKQTSASGRRPKKAAVYESSSISSSGLSPPNSSDSEPSSSWNTPVRTMSSIPLPSVSGVTQFPYNSDPNNQCYAQTRYCSPISDSTDGYNDQPFQSVKHTHSEYPVCISGVSTANAMYTNPSTHIGIDIIPSFSHHAQFTWDDSSDNFNLPVMNAYSQEPSGLSPFDSSSQYSPALVQAAPIALPLTSHLDLPVLCAMMESLLAPTLIPDVDFHIQPTSTDCVPPFAFDSSIAVTPYEVIDMMTRVSSPDYTSFLNLNTFSDPVTVNSAYDDSPSLCWSECNYMYNKSILGSLDHVQFGFY